MKKIAIIVPLREELKGILELLKELNVSQPTFSRKEANYVRISYHPRHGDDVDIDMHALDPENRDAMGNVVTSARVAGILADHRPHLMLLVGIAGSMNADKVRLGDVVVSIGAKYLQPDKLTTFKDALHAIDGDCYKTPAPPKRADCKLAIHPLKILGGLGPSAVMRFRKDYVWLTASEVPYSGYADFLRKRPIQHLQHAHATLANLPDCTEHLKCCHPQSRVHFGDILGSEWVVDDLDYIAFVQHRNNNDEWDLYKQRDLVRGTNEWSKRNKWDNTPIDAVDMETYGFFKAVAAYNAGVSSPNQNPRAVAMAFRGISDMARDKDPLDDTTQGEIRKLAVRNAVRVAIDFIDFTRMIG